MRDVTTGHSAAPGRAELIPQLKLSGQDVHLWPVRPEDHEFMYWIAACDQNAYRWRFRGNVPPFEIFQARIHQGILTQFIAHSMDLDRKVGHVMAYDADLSAGHVRVGAVMDPNHMYLGAGREALQIFVRYLFDTWAFRTVYAEVPEYLVELFRDSGGLNRELPFVETGRLPGYLYHQGRFFDMVIFALSRERFDGSLLSGE